MKSIFDNSRRYAVAMDLNTISAFRLGRLLKKYVILLVTFFGLINRKQTVSAVVVRSDHNSYVSIEKEQINRLYFSAILLFLSWPGGQCVSHMSSLVFNKCFHSKIPDNITVFYLFFPSIRVCSYRITSGNSHRLYCYTPPFRTTICS